MKKFVSLLAITVLLCYFPVGVGAENGQKANHGSLFEYFNGLYKQFTRSINRLTQAEAYSVLTVTGRGGSKPDEVKLEKLRQIISSRLDSKGFNNKVTAEDGKIVLKIYSDKIKDKEYAKTLIKETIEFGLITFQEIDEDKIDKDGKFLPTNRIIVSGHNVVDARPQIQEDAGYIEVSLQFDSEGAKKFAEATKRLIGERIGIFLGNKLLTAPTVQAAIMDGKAVITGQRDMEEASELANNISMGILDLKIDIKELRIY